MSPAAASDATRQSPTDPTRATRPPDKAIPAPTHPYTQPTRWGLESASSVRTAFPATMEMTALATPAAPRSRAQVAS